PGWAIGAHLAALALASGIHDFFDLHGSRGGLPLIIVEPATLLVFGKRAQAQPDLLLRLIHFNDFEIHFLADWKRRLLAGAPIGPARDLRAVAQGLHAGSEFHESPEAGAAAHAAAHDIAHHVSPEERFPSVGLQLLHAQRETAVRGIDVQND